LKRSVALKLHALWILKIRNTEMLLTEFSETLTDLITDVKPAHRLVLAPCVIYAQALCALIVAVTA
jgi:hypothetical protein